MKKLFIILLMLFIVTGCDSHQEINELGIVSALGVEKQDDIFTVSAQLVNIKKSTEGSTDGSSNIITFVESGKTMFECLRKITTKSSKKLYFAHMKIFIIDKSILNDDQNEVIDFLTRDSESMINYFILASVEDKPSDILKTVTPLEELPAEYIVKLLKTSEKSYGNTYSLSFENYIDNLVTIGKNPSFTKISLVEKSPEKNNVDSLKKTTSDYIELGNILVFDKDKKLTELSMEQSVAFNIMNNNIINAIVTLPCEKEFYTLEAINSSTKMNFEEKTNELTLTTDITYSISDYLCPYDLLKKETINNLKAQVKEYTETSNNNLLKLSQEYNNDFLGIGLFIDSNYKKYFDFKNKDWDKEGLPTLILKSKVNVEFEKRGNILNIVKERGTNG